MVWRRRVSAENSVDKLCERATKDALFLFLLLCLAPNNKWSFWGPVWLLFLVVRRSKRTSLSLSLKLAAQFPGHHFHLSLYINSC